MKLFWKQSRGIDLVCDGSGVEAVLFDLDQTLIDRQSAAESLMIETFGHRVDMLVRMRELDRGGDGDRESFFCHWRQYTGGPMDQGTFARRLVTQLRPDVALIDELQHWAQRFTIGLVTNGGVVTQRMKLRASGLECIFPDHRIWISEALGVAKPDPAVFARVCRELAVNAARCVHIGDSLENDVVAARRAGLQAIRVRKPLTGRSLRALRKRTQPSGRRIFQSLKRQS